MVPICSECQHLVEVFVTAGDPPLYWCNNPETKELLPPIGCVRRNAPGCNLFAPIEDVRAAAKAKPTAAPVQSRVVEQKTVEAKVVVRFCLLMTLLTLIPVLLHEGERAVIALSDFARTCRGGIEVAIGPRPSVDSARPKTNSRPAESRPESPTSSYSAAIESK
jgi:hypothetical protein